MGLITVTDLKNFVTTDKTDMALQGFIDRASAMIEEFTKTIFEQKTITEDDDGGGLDLIMSYRPIISVTSITDHGESTPTTVDAATYTVYKKEGLIRTVQRGQFYNNRSPIGNNGFQPVWRTGAKRYEIIYEAGFLTVPLDIQQAALIQCSYMLSQAGQTGGAYQSESIGDYSYTLGGSSGGGGNTSGVRYGAQFPPEVLGILRRYTDVSF